jgi:hypothetical protein
VLASGGESESVSERRCYKDYGKRDKGGGEGRVWLGGIFIQNRHKLRTDRQVILAKSASWV